MDQSASGPQGNLSQSSPSEPVNAIQLPASHGYSAVPPAPADAGVPDRFQELYRKVSQTAKLRFLASYRLSTHHRFSQWSIALLSVALIVIPLLQVLKPSGTANSVVLSVIEIVLAVLVLVFSLLIGAENYAVRADRMHTCGQELNELARKLEKFRTQPGTDQEYEALSVEYSRILRAHENHGNIDYLQFQVSKRETFFPSNTGVYYRAWIRAQTGYLMEFLPYFVFYALAGVVTWLLLG
jgi:hypothetical protein